MENLVIRKAKPDDLEILLQFEQGVITAERPFDETLKDGDIHYYDLAAMINSPTVEVVVAELAGQIAGSGYARIETAKPYNKHEQHAYLGFMYVVPQHRGKGINAEIINALMKWAASKGITELTLEVYDQNTSAIKAYEKIGFKKQLVKMRLGLTNE